MPRRADDLAVSAHLAADRPAPESAARREQILDAAERLFADEGFSATSMRDIAQATGLNVATLYYHCGSKEQLFGLIYARMVRRLQPLVSEGLAGDGDFASVVARVLDRVVAFFVADPRSPRLLLRLALGDIPGGAGAARRAFAPFFERVAQDLARRARAGEIRRLDPARFVSGVSGAILHLALRPPGAGGRVAPAELASIQAHARAFVLGALGVEPPPGKEPR